MICKESKKTPVPFLYITMGTCGIDQIPDLSEFTTLYANNTPHPFGETLMRQE